MKQFGYLCAYAVVFSCQGVTPIFAGDVQIGGALHLSQKGIQSETVKPGEAATTFQNIEGTLKEIQGNVYVVEGKTSQQSIRVEIGQDTAFPNGTKEPGQMLQALISTSDGHALIIR